MTASGQNRIYVCGGHAYDNELAMYRHEGIACRNRFAVAPVFEARPRFAYRIVQGDCETWTTDAVEVFRLRRRDPAAAVEVVAVRN